MFGIHGVCSLIVLMCALLWAGTARGQQLDNPVVLPVSYYGEGIVTNSGQPYSGFSFGAPLGNTTSFSGSYLTGGSHMFSNLVTSQIYPGRDYVVQVTSTNFMVVFVHFAAVPGYQYFFGPTAATATGTTFTLGSNYTFHFRLEAINDVTQSLAGKRGGECSSLPEDKAIWYIGLGSMRNGRFAGGVGFRSGAISSNLFNTSSLLYDSVDTSEVSVTRDGNGYITSIQARDVKLVMDAYNSSGTSYHIYVYHMNPDGTVGTTAFITYTIARYTSGGVNGLEITRIEDGKIWGTRLIQGASNWTLYDWREYNGGNPWDTHKCIVTTVSGLTSTVDYGGDDAATNPVVEKLKTFSSQAWGNELASVTMGPGVTSAPVTSYSYYTSTAGAGWARALNTVTSPTGAATTYSYFNAANDSRQGLIYAIVQPWLDTANSSVETRDYGINYDGSATAMTSKVVSVGGATITQSTWSYNWSYPNATTFTNSHTIAQIVEKDYSSSTSYLTTTTLSYRPDDASAYFQSKPHAITHPDGTKECFAYYSGTWDVGNRTFTQADAGSDRLVLCFHGQLTAGTAGTLVSVWALGSRLWALDSNFYLVPNMSTVSESVTDTTGHVVFTAEDIVTSGTSMERISGTAFTFNDHGLLTKTLDTIRTVPGVGTAGEVAINYAYVAGQLTSKTDADGTKTTYVYSDNTEHDLRNISITTAAGGSGSYPERKQSFTYNLADLKLTAQESANSPTVTTYEYEKTGRLKSASEPQPGGGSALVTNYAYPTALQTTVTLPTNATLVTDLYVDGRIKDEAGTGRVPTYYDYATTSYGIIKTTRNGSGSAYPWSEAVTDGLGRVTRVRTPEFGWTSGSNKSLRKISIYSASTGQLVTVSTTDESAGLARVLPDHLYHYTDLGRMDQEGDDRNSNGSLDTASTDRITNHLLSFYKDTTGYNGWIRHEFTQVYRTLNNSADLTNVSEIKARLTRFNNGSMLGPARVLSDVVALDSSGRWTVTWDWSDVTARERTRYFAEQGESSSALTLWQDGYLESEQSISGVTKTYAYDGGLGLLASVTEGTTNAQTSYQYYSGTKFLWKSTQTTGASSDTTKVVAYTWDTTNHTTTVLTTDAGPNTSYVEYDARGLALHTWGSGAQPSAIGYDSYGRKNVLTTWQNGTFTGVTWPSPTGGNSVSWTIDPATGLASRKTFADGSYVDFTYNTLGQPHTRKWARGVTATYDYFDGSSRAGYVLTGELQQATYSDATPAAIYSYTRTGALAGATDATGTRQFTYRGDLKSDYVTLGSMYGSRNLTSTYDSSVPGRYTGYSFPSNVTVGMTLGYDGGTGHISSVQGTLSPNSTTFTLSYATGTDWVNSVTSGSFSRSTPLVPRYDVAASATATWNSSTTLGNFSAQYTDIRGWRSAQDIGTSSYASAPGMGGASSTSFTYDSFGELKTTACSLGGRNFTWNYDLAGNRSNINTEWGGDVTYTPGTLNQYTAISNESSLTYDADENLTKDGTWDYAYDGENRLRSMTQTGQTLLFTYDYLGRRVRKDVLTGTHGLWGEYFNNTTLSGTPALARTDSTVNFSWGGGSPGTGVNGSNISARWSGSVTPTSTGIWTFYTDSDDGVRLWVNGQLLINNWTDHGTTTNSGTIPLESGKPYSIRMEWYQGGGGSVARLHWAGPGLGDQTIPTSALGAPQSSSLFVYYGWTLAAELDGKNGGAVNRSYIWGPDFSNAQGNAGGAGALLGTYNVGWALTYAMSDTSGNIVGNVDGSGNIAAAAEFSAFGRVMSSSGNLANYPIGYSGQYTDSETGLVYFGLRYYNPKHGRFINRDPIEEAGGYNLYSFVGNSPTQGWDVLGMDPSPYWVVDQRGRWIPGPDGKDIYVGEKGHMVYPINISGEGSDDPVENIFRYGNPQGITGTLTFSMENGDSLVLNLTHLTQDNIQSAMAYYSDVRKEFATARQDVVEARNAINQASNQYEYSLIAANKPSPSVGGGEFYPDGTPVLYGGIGKATYELDVPWAGHVDRSPDGSAYLDAQFRADLVTARGGYQPGQTFGPSANPSAWEAITIASRTTFGNPVFQQPLTTLARTAATATAYVAASYMVAGGISYSAARLTLSGKIWVSAVVIKLVTTGEIEGPEMGQAFLKMEETVDSKPPITIPFP